MIQRGLELQLAHRSGPSPQLPERQGIVVRQRPAAPGLEAAEEHLAGGAHPLGRQVEVQQDAGRLGDQPGDVLDAIGGVGDQQHRQPLVDQRLDVGVRLLCPVVVVGADDEVVAFSSTNFITAASSFSFQPNEVS